MPRVDGVDSYELAIIGNSVVGRVVAISDATCSFMVNLPTTN